MIGILDTDRPPAQQTRLDRLALLLSRHVADAGQAENQQQSATCSVVASINPVTPSDSVENVKQQLQIQLRSSSLCCGAGTADVGDGQAAGARLQQKLLPPHVRAVYTLKNSELSSISKVRCHPA